MRVVAGGARHSPTRFAIASRLQEAITCVVDLKAIVRGYTYEVLPIRWCQRKHGASRLRLKEMGSRYLFIVLYVWLEKTLTRGDYRRPADPFVEPSPERREA